MDEKLNDDLLGGMVLSQFNKMLHLNPGLTNEYYGIPSHTHHVPATLSKGEKKKCKSCAHFLRGNNICYCDNPLSDRSSYLSPMDTACNHYERKKK